jgi:WD40 repeat protein
VRSLSLSSENMIISGSEDRTIKIWTKSGKCKTTIEGPLDFVRAVLGVSNNRVVAATRDFELACYDINSG